MSLPAEELLHPATSTMPYLNSDGTASEELPQNIAVMASSDGLGWRGVHLERAMCLGGESSDVRVPMHILSTPVAAPFTWESKSARGYTKHNTRPGQLWINPANTPFSHRASQPKEFVHLALAPEWLDGVLKSQGAGGASAFEVRYNVEDEQLANLIFLLMREAEGGGKNGPLFADSIATALAVHLGRNYAAPEAPAEDPRGGLDNRQLKRAVEFMRDRLGDNITLGDISRAAGMSKFRFSRSFKAATGSSPYNYLMNCRLERAREQLGSSGTAISEIAYDLNFSDQSHMSRLFKRSFGMTPRAYRQSLQ